MKWIYPLVKSHDEYWKSIQRYNSWFIKLRFLAIISLILFIAGASILFDLGNIQFTALISTCALIIIYNLIFLKVNKGLIKKNKTSENLEFSFVQIILDLIALSLIVYFTGGIETPLFMFYIFHMIIGSILLPTALIYSIAVVLIFTLSLFTTLEYYEIITHQSLNGLYAQSFYDDAIFIIAFLAVFSFVLIISIYLTSKIAYDLYRREDQLKLALDEIEKNEESKQKYIMGIVHELKSPISVAQSFLYLLLESYTGSIDNTAKTTIQKAEKKLNESIDGINEVLKISRFKLFNKLETEKINLGELISEIIETYKERSKRKNIKIENNIDKAIIEADATLLKLALSNLISNAIKYNYQEGRILVELKQEDSDVLIKVSDNGMGIPKKDQTNIFDDFYRASNVKEKEIEGTGTGLTVVRQIIEAHGGEILLNSPSEIGEHDRPGTTFTIKLFS
jgi:signal transduction histidine kinase